jgi:D-aspartate ligase
MKIAHTSTPVVVLASPHHGGLAVTRSLGRLGIPLFNVDATRWAPALFSRYCRGKFVWDLDSAAPAKSVDRLVSIARGVGRRCILIPTTDQAAIFVSDHGEHLKDWYLFPSQQRAIVHSLCSKKNLWDLARKFRVPTPQTFCPQSRAELLEYLESVELPVMVKGVEGKLKTATGKTKMIIRSRQEARALHCLIEETTARNLIVQEYIPGAEDTVWMFNGYFNKQSECLAAFTGRKLRQCPIYTGVTSLGICQKNEVVEENAKQFMQALGYQGIVDIDFRFDARDGQYKVLDVNPRIGSTFRLFVSNDGMDVARILYLDLTGQPVTPARAQEGRKWMVEDYDLAACFRYRQERKLILREWFRSLSGIRESAFLAKDDPIPMLMMLREDAAELWRRRTLRVAAGRQNPHSNGEV